MCKFRDSFFAVELKSDAATAARDELEAKLLEGKGLAKWAKPQFVRFAEINKNFKGAILYKELKATCVSEHQAKLASEQSAPPEE